MIARRPQDGATPLPRAQAPVEVSRPQIRSSTNATKLDVSPLPSRIAFARWRNCHSAYWSRDSGLNLASPFQTRAVEQQSAVAEPFPSGQDTHDLMSTVRGVVRSVVLEADPVAVEPLIRLQVCQGDLVRSERLDTATVDARPELIPEILDLALEFVTLRRPTVGPPLGMGYGEEDVAPVGCDLREFGKGVKAEVHPLEPLAVPLEQLLPSLQLRAPA